MSHENSSPANDKLRRVKFNVVDLVSYNISINVAEFPRFFEQATRSG